MNVDVYLIQVHNNSNNEEMNRLAKQHVLHLYGLTQKQTDQKPIENSVCWGMYVSLLRIRTRLFFTHRHTYI